MQMEKTSTMHWFYIYLFNKLKKIFIHLSSMENYLLCDSHILRILFSYFYSINTVELVNQIFVHFDFLAGEYV